MTHIGGKLKNQTLRTTIIGHYVDFEDYPSHIICVGIEMTKRRPKGWILFIR
jgi:hypothetical protein